MCVLGKLYALHSGDGRILWSVTLDRDVPVGQLFLSASSHDHHQSPQVLLIGTSPQKSIQLTLNAHTGQVLEQKQIPVAASIQKVR